MTYYLPLITLPEESGAPVGLLEVLDWALVDGRLIAIDHSVLPSSSSSSAGYTLVLLFPPFNSTLEYDPSINLGLLVGQQPSSSSPNLGLIIGTTVGIGGAAVVVLVIAMVAIVVAKLSRSKLKSINFS